MSSIHKYICTNEKCDLEIYLGNNSPVWKADTPEGFRRVPVMNHNKSYVLETVSSKLCKKCGVVSEVEDATYICPHCAEAHSFMQLNDTCPVCCDGVVIEDAKGKVWF